MLNVSMDVLAACIVPLFFVVLGLMWLACAISDLFKKK